MSRGWRWLGRGAPYAEVHALQQRLVDARASDAIEDTVLLVEHADTITLGRRLGAESNVLDAGGFPVVRIERGGDATWHGPGQLVAYPILRVTDLHAHLRFLEDAVLGLLAGLGLEGRRDPRNSGVWLPSPDGPPRKVCSVGIACRRWVSWHGLALNVDADLRRFARIRPCGFDASVMTRLADHLDPCPDLEALVEPLARALGADHASGDAGAQTR